MLGLVLKVPVRSKFEAQQTYQLYDSWRESLAWSAVSTVMISVQKSGPNSKHKVLMTFGLFGLSPERLSWVNCSSGANITRSGPKTTLKKYIIIKLEESYKS